MSIHDVRRLKNERDETQIELEEACRATFLPGMFVSFSRASREIIVMVVGPVESAPYSCIVRNPATGRVYGIPYESIIRIVTE